MDQILGGYRRIPVLQRGAHFYGDTRLAVEALNDDDPSVTQLDADDEALRDWAEREIFFAVFSVVSPITVLGFLASKDTRVITLQTMKSLEARMPANIFKRIHRSYIVNLDEINAVVGNMVEVTEKGQSKNLPIGKNYKDELLEIVNKNRL